MNSFRKLKAMMTEPFVGPPLNSLAVLQAAKVPLSTAECRNCPNPCDQGHDEYPQRFDVDLVADLLGSVKPYRRQVVVSTGKSDWAKDITEENGSIAAYLRAQEPVAEKAMNSDGTTQGVYRSSHSTRISILNGSHNTLSDDPADESVLIFPDYKIVTEVPLSLEGVQILWESAIDPSLDRAGHIPERSFLRSWVLPYSCVILLCSHKRRDTRCSIAAPKLETTFTQTLECEGWQVHTQIEHPSHHTGPPLEDFNGGLDEKEEHILNQLKTLRSMKRALILRTSHVGGHKFAGNCIIHIPQGSAVWYGRVTPHEVEAIVKNTIIDGKVLPPLVRAGVDIKPGCNSLYDW